MRRLTYLVLPTFLTMVFANLAPAQDAPPSARMTFIVGAPGQQQLSIALPKPVGGGSAAATLHEVVRRDLELSGWFKIIEPEAYLEPAGTGIKLGEFKWEDWEAPGAMALAKTGLGSPQAGKLRAEVWVYDVAGRQKLGAKAFTTDEKQIRTLAHRVAGEIIFQITGTRPPFNTKFAVAGNFSGNKEIYLVDFDGAGRVGVTKNGSININPSWSPRGNAVAFTSFLAGNPDLYVADLARGEIKRLSNREGMNTGPAWAPGGGLLALTLSPGGNPDIYTIDPLTGKQVGRLTNEAGIDVSPTFSPDGKQIAFVSDRSGGAQIYVMPASGGAAKRVTFSGGQNTDPAWSPDGSTIAFVTREGNFDVMTVRTDGTGLQRITQGMGDNEDPSWSPDGSYLAFSSTRAGGAHIWMATKDGVHQVQLTQGAGGYTNPSWSPSLEW